MISISKEKTLHLVYRENAEIWAEEIFKVPVKINVTVDRRVNKNFCSSQSMD